MRTNLGLLISILVVGLLSLAVGSELIPIEHFTDGFFGKEETAYTKIIWYYRFPKLLTAILVGISISTAGLLMQTLFNNPMAGPYVLGIQSGASLGVAILVMSGLPFMLPTFLEGWFLVFASAIGSFLILLVVLLFSFKIRQTTTLLIIGLLFGTAISSFVSLLEYFSDAERLRAYLFWSFGSLGGMNTEKLVVFVLVLGLAFGLILFILPKLDILLMGENYAKSVGLSVQNYRLIIIIATTLLAGTVTAFAGPIGFLGLAIPHVTRMVFQRSSHRIILLPNALIGALILIICDLIAQVPGFDIVLPLNAITALLGIPFTIWLFLGKSQLAKTLDVNG